MTTQGKQNQTPKNVTGPLIIIGALFFIFGFVTWINDTLIPYLRIACELSDAQSYLVTFAFFISYFVMAIPSSWVLKRTGLKNGMSLGLLVMSVGALLFIPAAVTRTYSLFLTGLFIIGTGLALLQTASNPYAVILGPRESAAMRISILGICNKIAGIIATAIFASIALKDSDKLVASLKLMTDAERAIKLDELASRVIVPYMFIAAALVGLALMVRFSSLPEIDADENSDDTEISNYAAQKSSVFQFPHLVWGVVTLFFYVGVEVMSGATLALYAQSQGVAIAEASKYVSYMLVSMIVGYILGIASIPKLLKQDQALALSALLGVIITLLVLFTSGTTSVFLVAMLGFANAVMWPAMWPLAIADLGKFTKIASALLVMAIAGGAIMPLVYGKLVESLGRHQSYWLFIPCYLIILWYALKGHKMRS